MKVCRLRCRRGHCLSSHLPSSLYSVALISTPNFSHSKARHRKRSQDKFPVGQRRWLGGGGRGVRLRVRVPRSRLFGMRTPRLRFTKYGSYTRNQPEGTSM